MNYTPIVTPIYVQPETCPGCGAPEKIKTVCAHCGHEYPEDDGGLGVVDTLVVIGVVLLVIWAIITILMWLVEADSLLEALKSQWHWAASKRLW